MDRIFHHFITPSFILQHRLFPSHVENPFFLFPHPAFSMGFPHKHPILFHSFPPKNHVFFTKKLLLFPYISYIMLIMANKYGKNQKFSTLSTHFSTFHTNISTQNAMIH